MPEHPSKGSISSIPECDNPTCKKIVKTWLELVCSELEPARQLAKPILIDTIPAFVANVLGALKQMRTDPTAATLASIAQEHGSERARLSHYRIDQVILEYQLLRRVIIEVLEEEDRPLDSAERRAINTHF